MEANPIELLQLLDVDEPLRVEPITGGADARMWRVDTQSGRFALRLLSAQQVHQAEQEIAISGWMPNQSDAIRVPRVVAQTQWNQQPAYLMEWIDGQTLVDVLLANTENLDEIGILARQFGETQAHIHQLPSPPFLTNITHSWRGDLGGRVLKSHLEQLCRSEASLLHLDFHPLNVMVNNRQIVAVLDWANAAIGHPSIDLARTFSILDLVPFQPRTMIDVFLDQWMEGYRSVTGGFTIPDTANWWAGELMLHEWKPRIGTRPGIDDAFYQRVEDWTERFRSN